MEHMRWDTPAYIQTTLAQEGRCQVGEGSVETFEHRLVHREVDE